MIQSVTQIVIAVKDLEEAIKSYEALGFQLTRRSKNDNLGINQAFVHMGDGTDIEQAQPFDPKSAVGRGVAPKGEGSYLRSVTVDYVQAEAQQMKEHGVQLIENGDTVFVHPRATKGVLLRLSPKR
jgi:methylmalonyl-CoA/ethylmalonyl-CoA epimerase